MTFGAIARTRLNLITAFLAAIALAVIAQTAVAQEAPIEEAVIADPAGPIELEADGEEVEVIESAPSFDYYGPEMIKGQPTSADEDLIASMTFQEQFTENGDYALWMHDAILIPMVFGISVFVLGLLLWVMVRYNRKANTVPSKTSHNTLIEVVWTVIPVLILVVIAVPSITLLARQYQSPPEEAITIKANGYQWYWGYEYIDNGGFEVVSNMLDESVALDSGEPHQLGVDNRMVVPAGVPIRIQTFGKDVIHSFGIPSLWFKLDAVPGRINERMLTIEEPGIYYGQCMELCGARHAFMPIAIEARPLDEFNAWVKLQPGGMTRAEIAAEEAAAAAEAAAAPTAESDADEPTADDDAEADAEAATA